MNKSNTNRALEQIVSVDGWIGIFDEEGTASVHADVVFREGHFGGDAANKVRFKVSLTRAEVVICVPGGEPLHVLRSSIKRTPQSSERQLTTTRETKIEGEVSAALGVSQTLLPIAQANLAGSAKTEQTAREEHFESIADFLEQHFNTPDKHPAWEVYRSDGKSLYGAPWNANESPRLRIRRQATMEQPFLRIEIRCRRQDLQIDGLELKDPEKQKLFSRREDPDKNMAAAEQIIKEELASAGFFELVDLAEDHENILIADVVILED